MCKIERDTFVILEPFLSKQNGAIKGISVKKRSENWSGRTDGDRTDGDRTDGRTDKHTSKFWRYLHNKPFGQLDYTSATRCGPVGGNDNQFSKSITYD